MSPSPTRAVLLGLQAPSASVCVCVCVLFSWCSWLSAPKPLPMQVRRLIIFDGICVLCNSFGRAAFYRLVNPDLVSFVPFQDAQHCVSVVPSVLRDSLLPTPCRHMPLPY